jgi:BirA family biotin operon repressor/biotin-[acetyl-CoA-carboxylase] ligase
MGRTWHSEADSGLYLTLILRPVRPVPLMTLAVGLGVRAAIAAELPLAGTDIRWPNDILLSGRKCAGILLTSDGDAVLAGVGVNVNHRHFPEDIAQLATSLALESAREHDRERLLAEIVNRIEAALQLEPEAILREFTLASSYVNGRLVELEDSGERGTTRGLDDEGFLLMEMEDSTVKRVIAGGVRPL